MDYRASFAGEGEGKVEPPVPQHFLKSIDLRHMPAKEEERFSKDRFAGDQWSATFLKQGTSPSVIAVVGVKIRYQRTRIE
jgi:hypothetical protein